MPPSNAVRPVGGFAVSEWPSGPLATFRPRHGAHSASRSVAQLVRAPVQYAGGPWFKPRQSDVAGPAATGSASEGGRAPSRRARRSCGALNGNATVQRLNAWLDLTASADTASPPAIRVAPVNELSLRSRTVPGGNGYEAIPPVEAHHLPLTHHAVQDQHGLQIRASGVRHLGVVPLHLVPSAPPAPTSWGRGSNRTPHDLRWVPINVDGALARSTHKT